MDRDSKADWVQPDKSVPSGREEEKAHLSGIQCAESDLEGVWDPGAAGTEAFYTGGDQCGRKGSSGENAGSI